MKVNCTWNTIEVSTVNGYAVQVITTYSSFDKNEIDELIESLKDKIGTALIVDNIGGKE